MSPSTFGHNAKPMIGIYDSGIGGLLVAAALERRFPRMPLVYCNDSARAPLAGKSADTVREATRRGLTFLSDQGATVLVVAGNTAACVADEATTTVGHRVFTPLAATVAEALAATSKGRIGIIGGTAVIASGVYDRAIRQAMPSAKVVSAACPLLPALVEAGWSNKRETKMILRRYLHPFKEQQIDTLILGCGHYFLLHHLIQARAGKRVRLIDSSLALADSLALQFAQQPAETESAPDGAGLRRFFASDRNPTITSLAARLLARPVELLPW